MQQQFKQFLEQHPDLKTARILLAISGGVDSMVLWDLLEQASLNVSLAHVNFQLRAAESERDQNFLEEQAKKRNVKLHILSKNTVEIAKAKGQSTQIAAREIRYAWFKELMEAYNYDFLLTAHHLDDSIETFFVNLNRGTGLKGLTGIQNQDNIYRPLLEFTKSEIYAFAKHRSIPFREDKSNANSNYLRNWFRNEILTLWKAKNPAFETTMKANMLRLQETQEIIEKLTISDLREIPDFPSKIYFQQIEKMQMPKISLMHLFDPIGFNYDQMRQMLLAIKDKNSGKQFFSNSHSITVDRDAIFIEEQQEAIEAQWIDKETKLLEEPFIIEFDFVTAKQIDFKHSQSEYLDAEKLQFPLKLRKWRQGDRIKPLGMRGTKLVSDLLIDKKIPLHLKQKMPVLLSGKQLVAVIGLQISDDFKISDKTQSAWRIKWRR